MENLHVERLDGALVLVGGATLSGHGGPRYIDTDQLARQGMSDWYSRRMCGDPSGREKRNRGFEQRRLQGFDYSDPDVAYFVTACARAGTTPFIDARIADEVVRQLEWLRANKGMSIYAYCLMPDHLHLLLRLGPESGVLGNIIGKLKLFTTRASWQYGYTGKLWQDRFYDHVLRKSEDGARIAAYIWENPVRKGLVSEASGYLYSGFLDPM